MDAFRFRFTRFVPVVLTSFFFLGGCGGQKLAQVDKGKDYFACGNQTVGVVPGDGTNPKDVYLCKGDVLTWVPNGHAFTVTFKKKYPFEGPPKTITNNPQNPNAPVDSPAAIYSGSLVVYQYEMTIDSQPVEDPRVVGGGGHSP